MSKGIWVSPDQFVQFAEKKAFSDHVVTRDRSPDFAALGSYLPNPDPILRARGKTVEIYRELRGDAAVGAGIRRRKAAVAALEWGLERGHTSARNEANIKAILDDLDINQLINDVLEAPLYGYQPIEVLYGRGQRWTVPVELVAKPPEWFVFSTDNELRFKSRDHLLEGEALPPRKFLLPRNGATYQNPWGIADLAMVFWPATFKKGGMRFWMQFAEKYGTPWLIGKVPRNTDRNTKDALAADLETMIQDAIAVVPDDSSVEIVEAAAKAGAAEAFEKLLMWCRSEINIALLGQNQTTEASSTNASAKAGLEVADDLRDSDARLVESTVNRLIVWVMEVNGIDGPAPKFSLWEQQEVDDRQAKRDEILSRSGVTFSPAYWKRSYDLKDEDLLAADASSKTPVADNGPAFAEGADVSDRAPDQHQALLRPQLGGYSDQWFSQIESLVNQVSSLEELRDRLLTLYPALNIDDYASALGMALQASHLAGRNDIEEGI